MNGRIKKTILLVEDDAVTSVLASRAISDFGYSVITANSGLKAVEMASGDASVSLILMDIDLGKGIDGTEAARRILAVKNVPIVFLTSHSERDMVEKVRGITRYGYIIKNSGSFVLRSSIEMAFELFEAHETMKIKESELEKTASTLIEAQKIAGFGSWEYIVAEDRPVWSGQMFEIFGRDAGLKEPSWAEHKNYIHPGDWSRVNDAVLRAVEQGTPYGLEFRIIHPVRGIIWCYTRGKARLDENGKVTHVTGVVQDISERKRAEEALRESEEIFHQFMKHSPIYVFFKDDRIRSLRLSDNFEKMLGRPLNELIGKSMDDLFPSDFAKKMVADDIQILNEGEVKYFDETFNGRHYTTIKFPIHINDRPTYLAGFTIDITDRIRIEEALREGEAKLSAIFENSRDAIGVSRQGVHTLVNPAYASLFGYQSAGELSGLSVLDIIAPGEREAVGQNIRKRFNNESAPASYETLGMRKDGTVFNMEVNASTYRLNDELFTVVVMRDITRRKQAEEALKKSEERYRITIAAVDDGIWDWHIPSGEAFFNDRYYSILDYADREFPASYSSWRRLVHPEDIERVEQDLRQSIEADRSFNISLRMKTRSGTWRWVCTRGKAVEHDLSGKAVRMVGTLSDITAQKNTENSLKISEAQKNAILNGITTNIAFVDKDLRIIWANRTAAESVRRTPEEMKGRTCHEFWADPSKPCEGCPTLKAFQTKKTEKIIMHTPDGRIWEELGEPVFDENGSLIGVVEIASDITSRKKAEDELKKSQMLLISSIESPQKMIILSIDKQYRYLYFNTFHKEVMAGSYGKEVKLGMNLLDYITNDDDRMKAKTNYDRALAGESHITVEEYGELERCFYETRYNPIFNDKNEVVGATAFSANVTDRKIAEDKIKALLAEKELILKEVHHRIKNNMNSVMGLLSLQSSMIDEPAAVSALDDARGRIMSMMVLYDKLYCSADFNEISIKDYLEPLADEIVNLFPNKTSVKVEKNIEDFNLDSRFLSPIGIVLNELITNTMKHAFNGGEDSLIKISASLKDGRVICAVEDNGRGLPESLNIRSSGGFGLQLVDMLVKQIGGTIAIERAKGTRFVIEFKI